MDYVFLYAHFDWFKFQFFFTVSMWRAEQLIIKVEFSFNALMTIAAEWNMIDQRYDYLYEGTTSS